MKPNTLEPWENHKYHTNLPWKVFNSHKAGFTNIVSLGDDEPQNRKFICEIPPSDTTCADAELIVRAVNSYDALLSALREIADSAGHIGNNVTPAIIERVARNAIAKATI